MPAPAIFEHGRLLTRDDGSLEELGRGGLGITYKGFDARLRVPVALKVIASELVAPPEARQRLAEAITRAARLRHRHIGSIFRFGEQDGDCYYTMEFVDGESLAALLDREGALPFSQALEIIAQVNSALHAAQPHKLVHGGLKPANVMRLNDDDATVIKVLDFGLAHSLCGDRKPSATDEASHFLSPEQLDRAEIDVRADLYALGISLWRMLAGALPYRLSAGASSGEIPEQLPWEKLAEQPAPIVELLGRMLEKNPARRLATPSDLQAAIKRCRQLIENPAAEVAPPPPEIPKSAAVPIAPPPRTPLPQRVPAPPEPPKTVAAPPAPAPAPPPVPILMDSSPPTAREVDAPKPVEMVRTRSEPVAQIVELVPEPVSEKGTLILQQADQLTVRPNRRSRGLRFAIAGVIVAAVVAASVGFYLQWQPPEIDPQKRETPSRTGDEAVQRATALETQQRWGEALVAWLALRREDPKMTAAASGIERVLSELQRRFESMPPAEFDALRNALTEAARQNFPKAKVILEIDPLRREAGKKETAKKWREAFVLRSGLAKNYAEFGPDAGGVEAFLERMSAHFGEITPAEYEAMRSEIERAAQQGSNAAALVSKQQFMREVQEADELERRLNWREALAAWLRIAKKNNAALPRLTACLNILNSFPPPGLRPDAFAAMRQEVTEAAQFGVRPAQFLLGEQLRKIDPAASFAWYCEAAKNGETLAMVRAGQALLLGSGIPADPTKAVAFLKMAEERDNVFAMLPLAECYLNGLGVAPDPDRGVALLRRASDKGNADAQTALAGLYANGQVVKQDFNAAFSLYSEAEKHGDTSAKLFLALLLSPDEIEITPKKGEKPPFSQDAARARKLREQAFEKFKDDTEKGVGGSKSMYLRARCHENGWGTPKNRDNAIEWYVNAARGGEPRAVQWCKANQIPLAK